jgi:transposase
MERDFTNRRRRNIFKTVIPDPVSLINFIKNKVEYQEITIAYEAGFCGFWIQRELEKMGCRSMVVNPADIPTTDKDNKNKTDRRDSHKIALSLRAGMLGAIYVPTIEEEENQTLIRRRTDLIEKQTSIKNQIKSYLKKHGIRLSGNGGTSEKWSTDFISKVNKYAESHKGLGAILVSMLRELAYFEKEIGVIEKSIGTLMETERYTHDYNNLRRIPGIGKIVAAAILLELYNFERFKSFAQFACYMGIIPTEYSSGDKQRHGRMTKRGKTKLKSLIIEAAWISVRKDEDINKYYKELSARIKPQKAIIRCARKLLSKIFHIIKTKEDYKYKKTA